MMLNLVLLLLIVFSPNESFIDNQAQLQYYITNIENNRDIETNLWAINEVFSSSCRTNSQLETTILKSTLPVSIKFFFTKYPCGISNLDNQNNVRFRISEIALTRGFNSFALLFLTKTENSNDKTLFFKTFLNKWGNSISEKEKVYLNKTLSGEIIERSDLSYDYFDLFILATSQNYRTHFNGVNFVEFIDFFKSLSKSSATISELDRTLINLIIVRLSYDIDDYSNPREAFNSFSTIKLIPNNILKIRLLSALDYSFNVNGNYDRSIDLQRNYVIPLAQHLGEKQYVDQTNLRLANNLYLLGKFTEAKEILEILYNDEQTSISKVQIFNNLSLCYSKLGEQKKYTSLLLRALQESVSEDNYKIKLGIYRNLFVYYSSIGDFQTAIRYGEMANTLAKTQNDILEQAAIHSYLGTFYWNKLGDFEKTISEYSAADSLLKDSDNYFDYMTFLVRKAEFLISVDSLEEAKKNLELITDRALAASDSRRYLEAQIYLIKVNLASNNFKEIERLKSDIKAYSMSTLDFDVIVEYYTLMAKYSELTEGKRVALAQIEPVVEQILDRAKGTTDSQTGYWSIEDEYLDAFEFTVQLYLDLNQQTNALGLLDKLKTINDAQLYNNPLLKASKLSEEELSLENRLNEQLQSLRTQYLSAPSDKKLNLKAQIDEVSARREGLLQKVDSYVEKKDPPFWWVQSQLNYDELMLHFTELKDKLYVTSLTDEEINIRVIDLNEQTKTVLKQSADGLSSGKVSLNNLYQVYQTLGLESQIEKDFKHIIVVPDNYLFRIPLEVLPTAKPNSDFSFGSARYMIEDFSFEYYTSISEYSQNRRPSSINHEFDLSTFAISYFENESDQFLPSLPYATQEANIIYNKLTNLDLKKIFLSENATKKRFLSEISNTKIMHIATHSEVSEQDPLFSTIYLNSDDQSGSTPLYAYELFNSKLNNELIMLNSCSSGSGNYMQGTGIMGISRALRYAGAQSLALNLWVVNDKVASEFASVFYESINEGDSKYEAMRKAKLHQLKFGNANPHLWGAYSLIGNSSPIVKKKEQQATLYPFLIAIILFTTVAARRKKL